MSDLDAMVAAHRRALASFAHLLRLTPVDGRVPHLAWTAGELGAHVLAGLRDYTRSALEGSDVWTDLDAGDAANAAQLARTPERDPEVIADLLPAVAAPLYDAWRRAGGDVRWSGGLVLPAPVVAGISLGDALVHGWDLSRVTNSRFALPREDVVLALHAVATVVPHFASADAAGFTGTYDIRLRGDGRLVFAFDDGRLAVSRDAPARADCRLSADPAAFLLSSYGRVPVWRTAVSGSILAWGRRPWLAFRLKRLLRNP